MAVISILWNKFLVELQETSIQNIAETTAKIVMALFLLFILIDIPENTKRLKFAIFWHDMILLKILVSFLIVFRYRDFVSIWNSIEESFEEFLTKDKKEASKEWFGIPIIEIADYLFSEKKFPRADIMERFWISRSVADSMANELQNVEILVRGENNSRVLNGQFSRSDIVSILSTNVDNKLEKLFRKVENWYSHLPSMPDLLSPTEETGFVISELQTKLDI